MRAILITQTGGPEVLVPTEIPSPTPGPDQALIRLKAAGINFIDIYHRRGRYPVPLPFTPGLEGSGIVEAVGTNVRDVKVGDRVAYTGQMGSYAEKCVVDTMKLIPLPDSMTFEQGAAFPLQGMTAHYLLHEFYRLKPGETVLIHAAAGGMGLLLTQWAKHLGARVIGTVSTPEKAELAKSRGADEIIFYNDVDFVAETKRLTDGRGADFIIDGVGKTTFPGNLEAIKLRGHIVLFGAASGVADPVAPNLFQPRSITVSGGTLFNYLLTREETMMRAHEVIRGIQEGWLDLRVDHTLPLNQAQQAHTLLENRQTTGKLVLQTEV
jgi:NADPH2:quinone reductase